MCMDVCVQLGYMDVRWKKTYSSDTDDGAYMETLAFNGDPQLHMTVLVGLDASFVDEYSAKMRAFALKRIHAEQAFVIAIDMRHTRIDFNVHLDFIKQVGRVHEQLYEEDGSYRSLVKHVLIIVPNALTAAALQMTIHTIFKPLVKVIIRASDCIDDIGAEMD